MHRAWEFFKPLKDRGYFYGAVLLGTIGGGQASRVGNKIVEIENISRAGPIYLMDARSVPDGQNVKMRT
ncbi:MAG: hypothetical protein AAAB35_14535 [Phyllobacterium sp.]|uniref:hypothetical protein n=1 Tax=Phyllobacterium sp. TaxID=1871046 RepID=UPI0030F13BFA